ncbi:aromatic ring-hydroxylating oxygenase subunit alpha [Xylophilus ampelinus]|uniref:Phenylpropionate dioxygenase-like ring-hydroxylating dioxygenase large terminal subunit n=2 Tax=Xylophilus ampelinus TaxID=54067 RepID=A0A318SJ43_9BURK|nr:aromatic ring-hydroxylating dioxygenase subunit alpha [Xylophilus ampelinus]MCS4511203.1 aromatic ring-hydroxylating dioxygenase subunit alpha [Xylophilus ampelinus]PYE75042.1 phenylpropionate dioxygenase-like ring-hydroxylating dioxygenase large terminal subunit [Xylophilus ampelinus]
MQSGLLEPRFYTDPQHRMLELETLFSESWLFAGLRLELQGRSHMGVQPGKSALLLQIDDKDRPRAFLNVCSHRHAQLCEPGRHEGVVRCPYHGWVYDRQGVPVGIPSKQCFPHVVADPVQHRLSEFACEAVGQFIFVRLSPHGIGLHEYLGNQREFLERASVGMADVQDEFREDVPANWKVAIENALEGYHVPAVHNKTFMQVDGMSKEAAAPAFFLDDPRHSHLEHAANAEWVSSFGRMEKKIGRWPWRFEHYTHHLVFPNLTVTSFMGYSFHIQRFDPAAPETTSVHSRTVGVEFADATEMGRKMMERIHDDGHAFTRKVFAEDGGICAKVQAGLRNAQRLAVLGEGIEDRVLHFQRAYAAAMR